MNPHRLRSAQYAADLNIVPTLWVSGENIEEPARSNRQASRNFQMVERRRLAIDWVSGYYYATPPGFLPVQNVYACFELPHPVQHGIIVV